MNVLNLKNMNGRRAGLRKKDYEGPHLLQSIERKTSAAHKETLAGTSRAPSPPKIDAGQDDSFNDITRPPEYSSSDEDDGCPSADIKPSLLKRQNIKSPDADKAKKSQSRRTPRVPKNKVSPISSPAGSIAQSRNPKLGSSMLDDFERLKAGDKVKRTFGSKGKPSIGAITQKTYSNTERSNSYPTVNKTKRYDSKFKVPDIGDTEDEDGECFYILLSPNPILLGKAKVLIATEADVHQPKRFKLSSYESPGEEDEIVPGFSAPSPVKDKSPSTSPEARTKRRYKEVRMPSPSENEKDDGPGFRAPEMDLSDNEQELGSDEDKPSPTLAAKLQHYTALADVQPSQAVTFKTYDFDDSLMENLNEALTDSNDVLQPVSSTDSRTNTTQGDALEDDPGDTIPRCPMCKQPITAQEVKKCLSMNTRQQERFCRFHRKRDAEDAWSTKGYPVIDWDKLDARLAQHHEFLRSLLNGASCHYRDAFQDIVTAGKERNLLKMSKNLTPGYYGTRGLRLISENIMHNFSPLLKKRAVKDRLIAARGVTRFVQDVLVPEVTVLLIMEDMNIGIEAARTLLSESAGTGELVNEEIRDVVLRGSDDELGEGEEGFT